MNKRTKARLETRIKETVAQVIIRDLNDPRLGFITVTNVSISTELDLARVFVSVLGEVGVQNRSLAALESAAGVLQEAVGRVLTTRRTPRLQFILDDSIATANHVGDLIRKARREDDEAAAARGEDEPE